MYYGSGTVEHIASQWCISTSTVDRFSNGPWQKL